MHARIERGRIRIALDGDGPDLVRQQEQLLEMIGSLSPQGADLTEATCVLSVQNFRKLKRLGCRLSDDTHTQAVIASMREDLQAYEADSLRGNRAKQGEVIVDGYAFKRPPMQHQTKGWQFLHALREAALFGDCGTGKTFMVLTFADSLIKQGEKWVFLVICPINLIQHVWIDDAEKFSNLTTLGLRDTPISVTARDWKPGVDRKDPAAAEAATKQAKRRRTNLLKERFSEDADLYVINPENIRGEVKQKRLLALLKRRVQEGFKICLVIDESSKLKNRTSQTYRAIKKLRVHCERCIIMTGTPSPNGVMDLWSQFSVLDDGKTLHPSFIDYRAEVAKEITLRGLSYTGRGGQSIPVTKWEPRPGAAQRVYQTIEPRMIRFRTEDCIDLPPRNFVLRDVEMNQAQLDAYEAMEEMLFVELEGVPVTARVAAAKLLKLREITGGFIIADDKREIPLGADAPKMIELDTLLEQSIADKMGDEGPPNKAIIWAQYQWECRTLIKRYGRAYGARGLFGGISSKTKDESIRAFKTDPKCRVLVCHPASAGHGLTLIITDTGFVAIGIEVEHQKTKTQKSEPKTTPTERKIRAAQVKYHIALKRQCNWMRIQ